MIDIKEDEKAVVINAADVVSIEYSNPDGYGALDQSYVDQGASKTGKLRELLITLVDGRVIAITAMNKDVAPTLVYNPKLDVEREVAQVRGRPLPSVEDVVKNIADGVKAQAARDVDGKTQH